METLNPPNGILTKIAIGLARAWLELFPDATKSEYYVYSEDAYEPGEIYDRRMALGGVVIKVTIEVEDLSDAEKLYDKHLQRQGAAEKS